MVFRDFLSLGLAAQVELALVIGAITIALVRPQLGERAFARAEAALRPLCSRPGVAIAAAGLLAFALRLLVLPLVGEPVPRNGDDFSMLLQAQTFLQGRLSNPTPAFAEHFESRYVNLYPAYASMYFPGRGAPLAAGLLLFGEAWLGVWLVVILLCAATVWMLSAWLPTPFALLGGALVALRYGVFSLLINTLSGSALTALGGVLVIGAFARLAREVRLVDAFLLGVGVLLLMISRPFEAFLLCVPVAIAVAFIAIGLVRQGQWSALCRLTILPAAIVAAGVALLASYNFATTGSATIAPYDLNRNTYATAPAFLIQAPISPTRSSLESSFYVNEAAEYFRASTPQGVLRSIAGKLQNFGLFYFGPALAVPFLIGLMRAREWPVPAVSALVVLAGFMFVTWDWPNYLTPILGTLMLVTVAGLQKLRTWRWRGKESGLFLSRSLPLIVAASLFVPIVAVASGHGGAFQNSHDRSCCALLVTSPRSEVEAKLLATPGRDLIFVRHNPLETSWAIWVANEPDIETSEIVWAHDLGADRNQALVEHLKGRKVWLMDASSKSVLLVRVK